MTEVYVVLKNGDFTEGRGPMIFHKVFSTFEMAEDYIMDQPGIYGSPQGRQATYTGRVNYNGYNILTVELIDDYDTNDEKEKRKRIRELKKEIEELTSQLR